MLDSTIWREDAETKVVWVTMLLMADRDGIVEASVPGLADRARVSVDKTRQALKRFQEPDADSRTPDHEGRRIEVIRGGWHILNYDHYRQKASKDEAADKHAARQARYRASKKASQSVTGCHAPSLVTPVVERDAIASPSPPTITSKTLERDSAKPSHQELPVIVSDFDPQTGFSPETERKLLALVNAHPKGKHFRDLHDVLAPIIDAMVYAIGRERHNFQNEGEAYMFILRQTLQYTQAVAVWPQGEDRFATNLEEWFRPTKPSSSSYAEDPDKWRRDVPRPSGPIAINRNRADERLRNNLASTAAAFRHFDAEEGSSGGDGPAGSSDKG